MIDPSRRVAAWCFLSAALLTLAGSWWSRPTIQAVYLHPHVKPAAFAAPPPLHNETQSVVVAVAATPTPTPQPVVIDVADTSAFEGMLHDATVTTWGESEWAPMHTLIMIESGMNPFAVNKSSGACSAFQFLPCSKLGGPMSDFQNQIAKGIAYIQSRYGTPSSALAFHLRMGWY